MSVLNTRSLQKFVEDNSIRHGNRANEEYLAIPGRDMKRVVLSAAYLARHCNQIGDQALRDISYLMGCRDTCLSPGDVAIQFGADGALLNRFNGFASITLLVLKSEAGAYESSSFANRHVVAAHAMREGYNRLLDACNGDVDQLEEFMSGLLTEAVERCRNTESAHRPGESDRARVFADMADRAIWSETARAVFEAALEEVYRRCPDTWMLKHHFAPGWDALEFRRLVEEEGLSEAEAQKRLRDLIERKRKVIAALYLMNSNPENLWRGSGAVNSALPMKYNQLRDKIRSFEPSSGVSAEETLEELHGFFTGLKAAHGDATKPDNPKTAIIFEYLGRINHRVDQMMNEMISYAEDRLEDEGPEQNPRANELSEFYLDDDVVWEKVQEFKTQILEQYIRLEVDLLAQNHGGEDERSKARAMKASADYAQMLALNDAMEDWHELSSDDIANMFRSLLNYDELHLLDHVDSGELIASGAGSSTENGDEVGNGLDEDKRKQAWERQVALLPEMCKEKAEQINLLALYGLGAVDAGVVSLEGIVQNYIASGLTPAQVDYAANHGGDWNEVPRDGNCLFHCLSGLLGTSAADLRKELADAIRDRNPDLMPYVGNPLLAEQEVRRNGAYVGEAAFMTYYIALLREVTITIVEADGRIISINGGNRFAITLARAHNHYWYL
ncbi:MAG: OTU domain-containing protein [Pseudomonadota bacterium]